MSALFPKADIRPCETNVRFVARYPLLARRPPKKSGPPEGILQEFCRIAGTSAGIDQSAEPLASILGVKNHDPTFFFARINSHA